MQLTFYFVFIFFSIFAAADSATPYQARTLYNSLDPLSIAQHMAFYEIYKETPEGKVSFDYAWNLLSEGELSAKKDINENLMRGAIQKIVGLVNKQPDAEIQELSDDELAIVDALARKLPNRKLKGYAVVNERQLFSLPSNEIDLARGLFLSQMGSDQMKKIRSYEALIDLMALQIKVRFPKLATPAQKIRIMNDFIFSEMGFRFPPHSTYAKDIDLYTFLPSVLDSRRGVCLGVSILYICLAQRLGLTLEMVTPPGHIYVRYRDSAQEINIETTARGIHVDSKEYLGIATRSLQLRNVKEVIGLAHFNQASVYWQMDKYAEALASYEKAVPYLPEDMLLKELMGYAYLLNHRTKEGVALLKQVKGHVADHAVTADNMADDYLNGDVDEEGIKAIFMSVDETRASVLKKHEKLQSVVKNHPRFRAGWFALASAWLQLHRAGEALSVLEHCHQLDKEDPTIEYYLTMLYAQRFDYNRAWEHFHRVENILKSREHAPKLLQDVRRELILLTPE